MKAALATALLFFLAGSGFADAAGADPALKTFLAEFSAALGRGGADGVVGLTHFPLKNSAYQQPKAIAKGAFKSHFGFLKGAEFAACLKSTAPQRATAESRGLGDWVVDCDGNVFHFAQFDGQWRYSGYENVNE
jgi:hypothetical protein